MHDFGYVALNMKYVNPEDSGTYTCRAINDLGEAVTSATLFVQCKYDCNIASHSYIIIPPVTFITKTNITPLAYTIPFINLLQPNLPYNSNPNTKVPYQSFKL